MKTMRFRDTDAEVLSERRSVYISGRVFGGHGIPVPARITADWIKLVCEAENVDTFEVLTTRHITWQRAWTMGAHYGEWKKEQVVGKLPRGGFGVLRTEIRWPGY